MVLKGLKIQGIGNTKKELEKQIQSVCSFFLLTIGGEHNPSNDYVLAKTGLHQY